MANHIPLPTRPLLFRRQEQAQPQMEQPQMEQPQAQPQVPASSLSQRMSNPLTQGGLGMMVAAISGGDVQRGYQQGTQSGLGMQRNFMQQIAARRREAAAREQAGQQKKYRQQDTTYRDRVMKLREQQFSVQQRQSLAGNPTNAIREFDFARKQGFQGTFMDFKTAQRRAGASQTTVNLPVTERSFDKEMGKKLAQDFVQAQETGARASADIGDLNIMRQAVENPSVYLGTGADAINSLKRAGQSLFGLNMEGVADAEIIESIGKKLAVAQKDQLPGPMSDSDRKFLVDMAPGLARTPEGNRRLIELSIAGKRYQLDRAQVIRDYAGSNGGRLDAGVYADLAQVDRAYQQSSQQIIAQMRQQPQLAPRNPQVGIPQVGEVRRGYRFKGGDPKKKSSWERY